MPSFEDVLAGLAVDRSLPVVEALLVLLVGPVDPRDLVARHDLHALGAGLERGLADAGLLVDPARAGAGDEPRVRETAAHHLAAEHDENTRENATLRRRSPRTKETGQGSGRTAIPGLGKTAERQGSGPLNEDGGRPPGPASGSRRGDRTTPPAPRGRRHRADCSYDVYAAASASAASGDSPEAEGGAGGGSAAAGRPRRRDGEVRRGSRGVSCSAIDEIAVDGEFADEGVDLTQGEGRRAPAVEVAADEAIVGKPHSRAAVAACSTTAGPCFLARARTPRMRRAPRAPS